jgi:hypothetical protein
MSETNLVHISPARAFAAFLLFAATGPQAVWLGLRLRVPLPDPDATHSVAALIVSPVHWPEPFAK